MMAEFITLLAVSGFISFVFALSAIASAVFSKE